jgi:hypothetical protein
MSKDNKGTVINTRHAFGFALALVMGGVIIWVIQLARNGDPIGYIILTGVGVLLALPVVGLVLYMLIIAIGKMQHNGGTHLDDIKTMRESHRVLKDQNQELARLLLQMQRNPTLMLPEQVGQQNPAQVTLSPGQVMTPEGFVIDGTAFSALDNEDFETEN